MTYNIRNYCYLDRDGDGQTDDMKPEAECEALFSMITSMQPDILIIQEMGTPSLFDRFKEELIAHDLEYPFDEYVESYNTIRNLALFSRYPIVSRQSHTDDEYTIQGERLPVRRGFIDVNIDITPSYRLHLIAAHLKSKVFHPLGQTEMRRNEARLLNNHIRHALNNDPDTHLIVLGDLNDTPDSASTREVIGDAPWLIDLRPVDAFGNAWTHQNRSDDSCSRIDYILVSQNMTSQVVRSKTFIPCDDQTGIASDHRPLLATFKSK